MPSPGGPGAPARWTKADIVRLTDQLADDASRLGLRHTLVTIRALRKVWLAHPGQLAYPSQERLGEIAGLCARTVRRHVRLLREAGLLEVFGHPAKQVHQGGPWTRKTNRYLPRALPRELRPPDKERRRHRGSVQDTNVLSPKASVPPAGSSAAAGPALPRLKACQAPTRVDVAQPLSALKPLTDADREAARVQLARVRQRIAEAGSGPASGGPKNEPGFAGSHRRKDATRTPLDKLTERLTARVQSPFGGQS